jgi:hypothetical protein
MVLNPAAASMRKGDLQSLKVRMQAAAKNIFLSSPE